MVGHGFLHNIQRPSEEGLSLGVKALFDIEPSQVVEVCGHLWMVGPQGFFSDTSARLWCLPLWE